MIIAGLFLAFKSNTILLKNSTAIKPFKEPVILITSGPFRFSRNPIYLSMIIILFGLAIFLGSISPFIFAGLFLIVMNTFIIPGEEIILAKLFGETYLEYKRKVRRWI